MAFADALPALQASLSRGEQPYWESPDGHPNAIGHRAIAEFVFGQIDRRGLGRTRRRAN
jgi:hypothetical protein